MKNLLASKEQNILTEHFRLTTSASPDRKLSIPVSNLLQEETMAVYLNQLAVYFPAVKQKVIASQFSKRYSFMVLIPSLFSMSVFNKQLNLSMPNCHIESVGNEGKWLPQIRLKHMDVNLSGNSNRQEWMNTLITQLFAEHLARVWLVLSNTARLPMTTLWENTAIYVYWLYETRMLEETDEQVKNRINADFHYLLNEAPGDLFGTDQNPLKQYYNSKCLSPASEQLVRIRKTCCLYYKTSSKGEYCSSCPKSFSP
jgi:ferric iron reductase protein FhuF